MTTISPSLELTLKFIKGLGITRKRIITTNFGRIRRLLVWFNNEEEPHLSWVGFFISKNK